MLESNWSCLRPKNNSHVRILLSLIILRLALDLFCKNVLLHCLRSWFYRILRRISKSQTKTYFNIINLFVLASCSLFYCLISISILSRFKDREWERQRERKKILVYIFVRETQIFIDKHKARCWS